jgi:hypothetical protein
VVLISLAAEKSLLPSIGTIVRCSCRILFSTGPVSGLPTCEIPLVASGCWCCPHARQVPAMIGGRADSNTCKHYSSSAISLHAGMWMGCSAKITLSLFSSDMLTRSPRKFQASAISLRPHLACFSVSRHIYVFLLARRQVPSLSFLSIRHPHFFALSYGISVMDGDHRQSILSGGDVFHLEGVEAFARRLPHTAGEGMLAPTSPGKDRKRWLAFETGKKATSRKQRAGMESKVVVGERFTWLRSPWYALSAYISAR